MKKGNAGFTLIELLAVVVVLAIVAVLGTSTVMPLLGDFRNKAFVSEANDFRTAGSDAVSLIMLGREEIEGHYTKITGTDGKVTGYCFTMQNLRDAGLFKKEDENYQGTVVATKTGNIYKYAVSIGDTSTNKYIYKTEGRIDAKDIKDAAPTSGYKIAC